MYTRTLTPPRSSFFLLGPRGVGKTAWIRAIFPEAVRVDLLRQQEFLRYLSDPESLRALVEATAKGTTICIDEVQKIPALLDVVHALMNDYGEHQWRFVLTGSSARKLRRDATNLLSGRALNRYMLPLVARELKEDFDLESVLRFGALPGRFAYRTEAETCDFLEAYVANYLTLEVQQEALVRNLDAFNRFLRIAARLNGQLVNLAGIARDAGVARPTIQGYFEVFRDTLIGFLLPSWNPRAKVRETSHPKLYFFDTGVARAAAGLIFDSVERAERGTLLETWVLHELRVAMQDQGTGGELSYWRTQSGKEVDIIWSRGRRHVGIEVKAAGQWRREDGAVLNELYDAKVINRCVAIYGGKERLKDGAVDVLPIREFAQDPAAVLAS